VVSRRHPAGFTLIEVVVSLTIMALVAAALTFAFRMAARTVERGEEAVHDSVRQRARFAVLERLFRAANPAPVPTDNGAGSWFRGSPDRVEFLSASPRSAVRGGAFRVVALAEGRMATGERGMLLTERSPFADPGSAGSAAAQVVFPGATGLGFSYVSGFSESGAMETEPEWDAREKKRLPAAVAIEFALEGDPVKRRIVVPVPVGVNELPAGKPG
jgi:prepilin-type N-terminal cleavage/methylation domain-containing protein